MLSNLPKEKRLTIVKILSNIGTDIQYLNNIFIEAAENGNLETVQHLFEKGDSSLALIKAAWNGHLDVVQFLVEKGVDVQTQDNSPLFYAVGNGRFEVVEYLLSKGAILSNLALIYAKRNGQSEMVKFLRK